MCVVCVFENILTNKGSTHICLSEASISLPGRVSHSPAGDISRTGGDAAGDENTDVPLAGELGIEARVLAGLVPPLTLQTKIKWQG